MSDFNLTKLANDRYLVRDDSGQHSTVLDGSEWNSLQADETSKEAAKAFDAAVLEMFKPLTEAAEAYHNALKETPDPVFYHVVQEGVEGVEAKEEVMVKLQHDTVVLRLIHRNELDRLIWLGDRIEILATPAEAAPVSTQEALF